MLLNSGEPVLLSNLCKYCKLVQVEWPENYVKGMKPLEVETHRTHDYQRCMELQGLKPQQQNNKKKTTLYNVRGWIRLMCNNCGAVFMFSRKHYTERDVYMYCEICEGSHRYAV